MDFQNSQISSAGNGVPKDELNIIKRLFTSLLLTVKNLSLYPQGHTICSNSINQFHTQLTAFLEQYGKLRLEIEREKVLYNGEIISEDSPEEGALHYILFRDGIRWIEFIEGIGQEELSDILSIINKYTKLSAEPEGDIVTTFWETDFPHMHYEVAEFFFSGDLETEKFTDLISGRTTEDKPAGSDWREADDPNDAEIDLMTIRLSSKEEIELKEMIAMEEQADLTSYLDALLDSLFQQKEDVIFSKILEALSEEFTLSLSRMDFIVTDKILKGLEYVKGICKEEMPWAGQLIDDFIFEASEPKSLAPLKDIWGQTDPGDAEVLRDIFTALDPGIIRTLVPLLSQSQPAPIRKMLMELIVRLASQDTRTLELALNNSNDNLLERLVSVIVKMDSGQSMKYLLKLSQHPSGHIRFEAVKGILGLEPARIRDMLDLVDDKDTSIRELILEQMGQSRDKVVEEFLLSHIKKNITGAIFADQITECFRILGRCGSSGSVPFLSDILFKWGFLSGSRRSILRRGAAIALCELNNAEADGVLERACKSMFSGVRNIAIKVREDLNGEKNNCDE